MHSPSEVCSDASPFQNLLTNNLFSQMWLHVFRPTALAALPDGAWMLGTS
jgi:hypothetical protein